MNRLTKLDPVWRSFTSRQTWTAATAAREVRMSTFPPEPVIPSKKPLKVELVGRKRHSWCSCGYSRKQPFCDGAHKTRAPGLSPLRFVPERDTTAWLCGCKHTNNPPYCDDTHKQDFIVSAVLHDEQTNC